MGGTAARKVFADGKTISDRKITRAGFPLVFPVNAGYSPLQLKRIYIFN